MAMVLDRRIERYKSRNYRSERANHGAPLRAQPVEDDPRVPDAQGGELLSGGKLVKVKRFDMNPMTMKEAVFQMNLLGHRFFIYMNTESDEYNLLYQREAADLGDDTTGIRLTHLNH